MTDYVITERARNGDVARLRPALVERHNGVWGGCWCIGFHPEGSERGTDHRGQKERRVRDGEAHAALVFDGDLCVGWCQFGSPEELPRIKFGRAYREVANDPPDWRITCFFVGRNYRHKGVAAAALNGALSEDCTELGGGTVRRASRKTSKGGVSPRWLPVQRHPGDV